MEVIDLRASTVAGRNEDEPSNLINLLDIRLLEVPERCRESLARIQGFMVFKAAEEIGKDTA